MEGKNTNLLYNSQIGLKLNYRMTLLGEANGKDVRMLQRGQNSAMRYILKCDRGTRVIEMLYRLDWLCSELLVKSRVFIFLYQVRKRLIELRCRDLEEVLRRKIERQWS